MWTVHLRHRCATTMSISPCSSYAGRGTRPGGSGPVIRSAPDAGVRPVPLTPVLDVDDVEPGGREHRFEKPPERAVFGSDVLGVVISGVAGGRVGSGPGEPTAEHLLGPIR